MNPVVHLSGTSFFGAWHFRLSFSLTMVRTKNSLSSQSPKSQLQKKESPTKSRHPKQLWVGCTVKYKDFVCKVQNNNERKIVSTDTYKRDVHGVIAAAHPTIPFHWTVDFGGEIGRHDCDDKVLSKDPPSQKKPKFPKKTVASANTPGTNAGEVTDEKPQQLVSLCPLLQEQVPGYQVDSVKLTSDPLVQKTLTQEYDEERFGLRLHKKSLWSYAKKM